MANKASAKVSWQRALFLKEHRAKFPCNTHFSNFLKYAAVGRYHFLPTLPSSNVIAKLILCATYLTADEYRILGYGRAAELMNRVEDFHANSYEAWEALKDRIVTEYISLETTRFMMNTLIKQTYGK